jgi:hypothetical protein
MRNLTLLRLKSSMFARSETSDSCRVSLFKWANKDKDAAHIFKAQLEVMESPTFGYVTPDMYKGQKLDL